MRIITESLSRPDVERMTAAVSRLAGVSEDVPGGVADDVTIDLRIFGGAPSQRVEFQASILSRGEAEVSYVDQLGDVSQRFSATVRPEELMTLARRLDIDALVNLPPNENEEILPDSLVGLVTIKTGDARITLLFNLDEVSPTGEETAMVISPGNGPFVLHASMTPSSVRPALEQLAVIVNGLFQDRP